MTPQLPLESPVLVVTVAVSVFLLAPLVLKRFGIPGTVGILLAGTVLGPHGLGVLERSETIVLLGTVGLLYLMFVAALEIDVGSFAEHPGQSALFGVLSFGIPLLAGTAVGFWGFGFTLSTSLLFASVFSSHTILAFPVIERLGLGQNRAVTAAVSGTIFTDTAALLVLAWVTDVHGAGASGDAVVRLGIGVLVLAAASWFLIPWIARSFFQSLEAESYFEFLFAMAVLFVGSTAAEVIGIEPLVGAFLAGLGLNRRISTPSTLQNRIDFVGNALFIPFFLFSVGMLVDPSAFLGDLRAWLVAGVVVAVMVASKYAAAWLTGLVQGFDRTETRTMFALTTGQAAAALAITLVAYDQGLFGASVLNGMVIMVAVMAVGSPLLSDRFGEQLASAEKEQAVSGDVPRRILIPILNEDGSPEPLLDLAMLLRGADSEEEIRVVRIVASPAEPPPGDLKAESVRPDGDEAEAAVAEAEADLEEVQELAASAEVEVDTQTRIDEDRVRAVQRAVEENRITTLLTEWEESPRFSSRLLASPADEILRSTDELFLAARLSDPPEALDRLVTAVPPSLLAHPASNGALHTIRTLAANMDAPQRYLTDTGSADRLESVLDGIPPEAEFEVAEIAFPGAGDEGWRTRAREVQGTAESDLVVVLLPRPDGRAWRANLEELLALPELLGVENAIVAFLPEERGRFRTRRFLRFT